MMTLRAFPSDPPAVEVREHEYSNECRCLGCADRREALRRFGFYVRAAPDWRTTQHQ